MRNLNNKISAASSVSASILSLTLTLMGFSKLQLSVWWHFIIAFFSVLLIYTIFYFLIEVIVCFYNKYIKRASIKSDVREELNDLKIYIHTIYDKDSKYEKTGVEVYREILLGEIYESYSLATRKIVFIDTNIEHSAIKNKFVLPNKEMYQKYKSFCEHIGMKYGFKENGAS